MRSACAAFIIAAVLHPAPARAQLDTRRMDEIQGQMLLRQGRAVAIGTGAKLPVEIVGLEEIRRPDNRARFAVLVKNTSAEMVPAYTVTAAIVGADGVVKAWQPLDEVKGLKPGQARRQEILVRAVVPSLTDFVAFAIADLQPAAGDAWKADRSALAQVIDKVPRR